MSIEYLLVTFPDERAVLADGARVGFTNHTLMLQTDEYEISLEGDDYDPKSLDVALAGTSLVKPKVISFTLAGSGAAAASGGSKPGKGRPSNG